MALLFLCGCADTSEATSTTTTTEAPAPIEYHDKYVDLKSGERLYYRYHYTPQYLLYRVWRTNLDERMARSPLFAKVKLETVRLDAFLDPDTITGYSNGAMAYDIQIQEIYHQDATWTDAMTDEVNNGLVYSHIDGYVENDNSDKCPRIQINIDEKLSTAMILEDYEYYVFLEKIDSYYIVSPIGEADQPFLHKSPLLEAWGERIEVCVSEDKPPELWDINNGKLTTPNTHHFQAYIRYTLKDEEYYQQIKSGDLLTYESALELLNNRPAA